MTQNVKLKVAVLGFGAIGKPVLEGISEIAQAELVGVVVRRAGSTQGVYTELTLEEALDRADLIVECAGGDALKTLGPKVVAAGKNLLTVSFGQLTDENLRRVLLEDGPGNTYLSTGAIGGLDILSAATINGGLNEARLTSRKLPKALVQNWMSEEETEKLLQTSEEVTVFSGNVTEAIKLFPASLNIAVALAAATGLWKETQVELVADPQAKLTRHEVNASGETGTYHFEIVNEPSPENPATSGVVAKAVLRGVAALAKPSGTFV
ncbi:MAG TPA: aspartate dehydrogenase domain-containing protein [Microbacteriaceae bacterium]|nr:aspartate dehydrogenase domain-containing protein [Microbacteriaceae bacterium]